MRIGLNFGARGTSFNGYLDEFRFPKSIARWTADFTPPAEPYPSNLNRVKRVNLAFTSLLLD